MANGASGVSALKLVGEEHRKEAASATNLNQLLAGRNVTSLDQSKRLRNATLKVVDVSDQLDCPIICSLEKYLVGDLDIKRKSVKHDMDGKNCTSSTILTRKEIFND